MKKDNRDSIKKIIDKWDPIQLLHMAPDDEYDFETKEIIEFIDISKNENRDINVEILANEINNIFYKAFSSFSISDKTDFTKSSVFRSDYKECLEVAEKIIKIL